MTPEKLKEIEQLYLENGDALDASSYCVLDLIHEVRALRIDNSRSSQWSGSICHANDLLSESQQRMSDRIKALEAEVEEQSRRESTWAQKWAAALDNYSRRLHNVRRRHIVKRREMQSKYRAEVAALMADKERLEATCGHLCKLAADRYDRILELEREIVNEQCSHSWTQAREEMAIRALRKGEPK